MSPTKGSENLVRRPARSAPEDIRAERTGRKFFRARRPKQRQQSQCTCGLGAAVSSHLFSGRRSRILSRPDAHLHRGLESGAAQILSRIRPALPAHVITSTIRKCTALHPSDREAALASSGISGIGHRCLWGRCALSHLREPRLLSARTHEKASIFCFDSCSSAIVGGNVRTS